MIAYISWISDFGVHAGQQTASAAQPIHFPISDDRALVDLTATGKDDVAKPHTVPPKLIRHRLRNTGDPIFAEPPILDIGWHDNRHANFVII